MSLGENIKKARKQKGITQKELSERIGKGWSTVQKYEIDVIAPPLEILHKIAAALDVPLESLLNNTNALEYDDELRQKTQSAFDLMTKQLPKNKLMEAFDKLNEEGQNKAVERVEELTEIPKYKK